MNIMKRVLIIASMILILIGLQGFAEERYQAEADFLNTIGMLLGTEKGYELDKGLTRAEAAVMIVRLQGTEAKVLNASYTHPFKDVPNWADRYVGYLYEEGLTKGYSNTLFGSNNSITVEEYVTFLLRVLGYSDKEGDFYWKNSLSKAKEINMVVSERASDYGISLIRGDMVRLSYLALKTNIKYSSQTLLENLKRKELIVTTLEQERHLETFEVKINKYYPINREMLIDEIVQMALAGEYEVTFDISQVYEPELDQIAKSVKKELMQIKGYTNTLKTCNLVKKGDNLTVKISYYISKEKQEIAINKAKLIVATIIQYNMTDIEKEQAIHDYLITHIQYDYGIYLEDSVYTMYGALIKGKAVCNGYTESFKYLGNLAGLDVSIITGEVGEDGERVAHTWNMVVIEGENYHVDITWDDPTGAFEEKVYGYFNVTDKMIGKTHYWNREDFATCTATNYNYYVYNKLEVIGMEGLEIYFKKAFSDGKTLITVRVEGVILTRDNVLQVLMKCDIPYEGKYIVDEDTNVVTIKKVS